MSRAEEMVLKVTAASGFICSVVAFAVTLKITIKMIVRSRR